MPKDNVKEIPNGTPPPAILPILKHKILMTEENDSIVLDISDETGGLGVKLYLTAGEAHRLGSDMMDRARFMVAKASDDPKRTQTQEFDLQGLPE